MHAISPFFSLDLASTPWPIVSLYMVHGIDVSFGSDDVVLSSNFSGAKDDEFSNFYWFSIDRSLI